MTRRVLSSIAASIDAVARRPKTVSGSFILVVAAYAFVCGGIAKSALDEWNTVSAPLIPVSAAERNGKMFFTAVPPIDISVHIRAPEEIKRRHPDAYAFSRYWSGHCEIFMPTGIDIVAWTSEWPYANFLPHDYGSVFAHELLHCLRGDWHPEDINSVVGRVR